MSYDVKCFELAETFLLDCVAEKNLHPDRVDELADSLAQDIQDAIESFIADNIAPPAEKE